MSEAFPSHKILGDRFLDRIARQFLRKGNWEGEVVDSGLPENVQDRIREVVQQTGLLRFEKSEIATELIHHFQDGHERGHSYEKLVGDFGTTEVAVSLFRSSKLRSRPMSVKAFRGSLVVFGGSFVGYLLLQLFFHSAKPTPTVDYEQQFNETLASMPEEEKAWPLYCDVWAKYGLVESGKSYDELWHDESVHDHPEVEWTNHEKSLRLIRPQDPGWDKATAKLESLKELLDVLREGSRRPYVGLEVHCDRMEYSDEELPVMCPGLTREQIEKDDRGIIDRYGLYHVGPISKEADQLLSQSTFGILLPHIQQFRRAARVLHVDTRYAIEQGDQKRAVENVKAIIGLGRQAGNNPMLVCSLVGVAVRGIGMSVVEELLIEHKEELSDETLKGLQNAVASMDFEQAFDAKFEKSFALDLVQRMYSDDGNGDGRMTAVGLEVLYVMTKINGFKDFSEPQWHERPFVRNITGPTALFTTQSRKEAEEVITETYDELSRHMNTKMWEDSDFDYQAYIAEKDSSGLLKSIVFVPSQIKQSREVKIARQDAVLLALACHRYKRANDQWPTSLDQLEGKWIDRTPIDRLNGKPLRFTIKDNAPMIYSVGHDGDDDGGVNTDSDAPWMDRNGDGDWVVWPQNEK